MSGLLVSYQTQLIHNARSCIGARFLHQGRNPDIGLDCAGLVYCTYSKTGFAYLVPSDYQSIPNPSVLVSTLEKHLVKTDSPNLGDVILFRIKRQPQHLGIYCGETFIHAYSVAGQVVEEYYNRKWKVRTLGFYTLDE